MDADRTLLFKGQLGCVVVQTHSGNLLFNSGSERRKSKVLNNFSRFSLRFQGALKEGGTRRTTATQLCIFCLFVKFRANLRIKKKRSSLSAQKLLNISLRCSLTIKIHPDNQTEWKELKEREPKSKVYTEFLNSNAPQGQFHARFFAP